MLAPVQLKKIFDTFDEVRTTYRPLHCWYQLSCTFCALQDGGGTIDTQELGLVMEQLGQHCTEAELMSMTNDIDPTGSGEITFDQFKAMMESAGESAGDEEDDAFQSTIIDAFASVDKERSGYVSADQLQAVTTKLGEALTDDEIEQLVNCCKEKGWVDDRGRISYKDWVHNEMGDSSGAD
jgi:Ca2+-binding EF-hand superfamily protein